MSHTENEVGRLFSDLFSAFKKALYGVKTNGQHLISTYFGIRQLGHTLKSKPYKIDPEIY